MPNSFSQGQLDGLCGLYSIVNAVRCINNISDNTAHKLFANVYKAAMDVQPMVTIKGLHFSELVAILATLNDHVGKRKIQITRPWRHHKFETIDDYLKQLGSRIQDRRCCAILSCGTGWHHWTVAERVTPTFVYLLDSSQPAYPNVPKSELSLITAEGQVRIHPRQTIILERMPK